MRTFKNTRAALAVFDSGAAARQHAWDSVESGADIEAAAAADAAALRAVQDAFYLDTDDINSRANCALADLPFMRRMAALREA